MHQVGPGCALMKRRAALDPGSTCLPARSKESRPHAIGHLPSLPFVRSRRCRCHACRMRHDQAPDFKKQFSQNVAALLAGKESAVVEAGKLTDFAWSRLCFEREDSLLLTFDQGGETSVLPLPYEEFFVEKPM